MIGRSLFDRGRGLLSKENTKRLKHLDQDEIGRLLDACINDHTRDIIETVIHTGMRRQEVLSLKWNQIRGGLSFAPGPKRTRLEKCHTQ
jgi:integrase